MIGACSFQPVSASCSLPIYTHPAPPCRPGFAQLSPLDLLIYRPSLLLKRGFETSKRDQVVFPVLDAKYVTTIERPFRGVQGTSNNFHTQYLAQNTKPCVITRTPIIICVNLQGIARQLETVNQSRHQRLTICAMSQSRQTRVPGKYCLHIAQNLSVCVWPAWLGLLICLCPMSMFVSVCLCFRQCLCVCIGLLG